MQIGTVATELMPKAHHIAHVNLQMAQGEANDCRLKPFMPSKADVFCGPVFSHPSPEVRRNKLSYSHRNTGISMQLMTVTVLLLSK